MKKISIKDLVEEGVSHNPEIRKKVIIKKGEVPHLTNYSQSCLKPGQITTNHVHENMFEIFHVVSGQCEIKIGEEVEILQKDECAIIYPDEWHIVKNVGEDDLILRYFGILEK